VLHEVLGHESDPVLRAYDRLELRPAGAEPVAALHLLAPGGLLEGRVDPWALGFVQLEARQPALVVGRHRRAVDHGALDVVDADVFPEHRTRVGVSPLDTRLSWKRCATAGFISPA
jgi:hypothetical protein